MINEQALLNCTFGWGKTCRLYCESIEIESTSYDLKDLTSIHPSFRVVFGVPSARLELSFGLNRLVLRGIADLDSARLIVSHLQPYCATTQHAAAHKHSRSSRSRSLARAQAKAWERTNKLPVVLNPQSDALAPQTSALLKDTDALEKDAGFEENPPTNTGISLNAVPKAPLEETSLTASETLEAFVRLASNLSTYASPLPMENEQPPHTPRFQPPLHSVHLIPPEQKFDSNSVPVPVVSSSVLPIIHIPVRLQHGECAHYSIGATLCSDRISSSVRPTYPLLDQGLLVLTNRRVLYMGKRCQFTLAYTHLWYVSLLHSAIALHIEGQFRRIIIELEHPQEWASRIELLAFIARRARPEPPTLAVAAIPGLNMTAKRPVVKPASVKHPLPLDIATVPLLTEQAASKLVEAETIDLSAALIQACADHQTLDFPAASTASSLELVKSNTPRSANPPAPASSPQPEPVDAPTQAIRQSDISTMATREFDPQPEPADAPTQAIRQSDVSTMTTREFDMTKAEPPAPGVAEDDDDDDRTIHLNDRKLCQLRTASMPKTAPERPPDSETTHKRIQRVRAARARHQVVQ